MKDIIVGLGEALWDVLPDGKKLGGAPANFAYHAGQFGFDSVAVSAVGDDRLGDETLAALDDKGLKYMMPRVPYPTGTVQVTLDDDGIPTYDIRENVAWDNIPFTPELEALARDCRAVCWGSLAQRNVVSRDTIGKFLDTMPSDKGVLKIFDINLRQNFYTKEVISESVKRCNVLKINDEELVVIGRLFGCPLVGESLPLTVHRDGDRVIRLFLRLRVRRRFRRRGFRPVNVQPFHHHVIGKSVFVTGVDGHRLGVERRCLSSFFNGLGGFGRFFHGGRGFHIRFILLLHKAVQLAGI